MGSGVSHAAAPPTPAYPPPMPADGPLGLSTVLPPTEPEKKPEKVDYKNLPCPLPFEEINREAIMALKPDLFEGLRFDFVKALNQNFALSHGLFMGSMEVPAQTPEVYKTSISHYEFGANYGTAKLALNGRLMTDGRLAARVKYDWTDALCMKIQAQLTNEPHYSQGVMQLEYKGKDYRGQFQLGNNALYGLNYMQSITPHLSVGTEVLWIGQQRKSTIALAARYINDKVVATAQLSSSGMLNMSYVQRISEKVNLVSDFAYNAMNNEVVSAAGYDYMLRQCRLRGKIDSRGVVSAFVEERITMGLNFILSAELDHVKKNYKFGFGMTLGE